MSTNELFKYDVRIRERMLSRGQLKESELTSYLEGLKDLEAEARSVSIPQPALAAASSEDDEDDEEEDEDDAPESTELP